MAVLTEKDPVTIGEWICSTLLAICFLAVMAVIPALGLSFKENPNTVKYPVDATLVEAHPFSKSTGKYSSEIAWEGRFRLEDGRTIDQNIDGFLYKNFTAGGEKPIKSWISVSGRQLWKPEPTWAVWRDYLFATAFAGLAGGMMTMLLILMICPDRERSTSSYNYHYHYR